MERKLSLQSVLDAFKGPVNEEQTWAICFQVIKYVQDREAERWQLDGRPQENLRPQGQENLRPQGQENLRPQGQEVAANHEYLMVGNPSQQEVAANHEYPMVENPSQILLHSDGSVSLESITSHVSEKEFISSLGIVLYEALDYGCDESEERSLEPSLEQFIEKLTLGSSNVPSSDASDNGGDDEGIERDSDSGDDLTLTSVLSMCNNHLEPRSDLSRESKSTGRSEASSNENLSKNQALSNQTQTNERNQSCASASKHYKAVVRAVVSEARDLMSFLDQIKRGSREVRKISEDPLMNAALDSLCVTDWARLWMQLVKDLRNGVRLKKVERNDGGRNGQSTVEYEMTPYEMLLHDIRSKRYHLRHVDEEKIPHQVRQDAHSLILQFIRSRPPLKSVSDRILPPTPTRKESTHDLLMRSIKKEHKLRPTSSLIERPRRQYTSLANIRDYSLRDYSLRDYSLRDYSIKETSQGFSRFNVNDESDQGMSNDTTPKKFLNRRQSDTSYVHEQLTPSPRSGGRKLIKADIDIDLVCYSDDEDIDSCVVTRRKSTIPTTTIPPSNVNDKSGCASRRSFRNLFGFGQSLRWNFKSNS